MMNMNNLNPMQKKSTHYGFSILKCLLAFNVLSHHCFKGISTKNRIVLFITKDRRFHVPSFFIMSFYFTHNTLISNDPKRKMNRYKRLLTPYLGWPIIIFIFNNIYKFVKKYQRLCSFKILIYQLITGQGQEIFHFWYLFDLIFTTFIFHFIIFISRKNYLFILNILSLFSYYLQYSKYSKNIYYYTHRISGLARENEMIPYAVTGFTIYSMKLLNILEKYKLNTFIICSLVYILTRKFKIFNGFFGVAYNGVKLNILSVCLVINFSLLPLKNIKNRKLEKLLKFMTNNSAGIYYLHRVVQLYFKNIFNDIKKGTFFGMILI